MDGSELVGRDTKVTFLDEFQMLVSTPNRSGSLAELALFDTLLLQGHPRNLRRFHIPMRYRNRFSSIITDRDGSLGTQDGPLIIDPAQTILVVRLFDTDEPLRILLVLRIRALITRACSMSSDTCIPWEEWERDVMVMEMPRHDTHIFVQGVHVTVVKKRTHIGDDADNLRLRTFDFSLRGSSTLLDKGGRAGRTDFYEGGRDFSLEGSRGALNWELNSLGNGTFYSLVSCPCRRKTYAYDGLIPS